ncbi:MAG: AAA family ATPase [Bacteroidota bacterium]
MQSFRVLFLADDALRDRYRSGIRQSYQLIGETADWEAGVFLAANLKADLVLLGYGYSLEKALETAEKILSQSPTAGVVLLGEAIPPEDLVKVMQSGIREFLPDPSPDELLSAIRRAHLFWERLNSARPTERPTGKVLVVHSPKGGAGKSTLAANLAVALHQLFRQEVALVDLDLPYGGQDLLLNLPASGKSVADLAAVAGELDFETAFSAMQPHRSGIQLLAAPPAPEEAETVTPAEIEGILGVLKGHYGWVVVDTSSELNELNLRVLELADKVLVPFWPDLVHLRTIQRALRIWEQLGVPCGKIDFCRWEQKSEVEDAAAERIFKKPIGFRLPYDPSGMIDAVNQGEPLILHAQNGAFARGMREMAAALTGAVALVSPKTNRLLLFWQTLRRMKDVSA